MNLLTLCLAALLASPAGALRAPGDSGPVPFQPDANTLLLYHFDEGSGSIARDASGNGLDGELRGAVRVRGRFGGGLDFDGAAASVFRRATPAITGLRRFTAECWYRQSDASGRQFLMGKDVTFHFDLAQGSWSSLSLYNLGGGVPNAEGVPHKQVGGGLPPHALSGWNHLAATYDGASVTLFLNGVLTGRYAAPRDFSLGADGRGLWIGCYVGTDYWFSGVIDEVRISNCVRYDAEGKLPVGARVFELPDTRPPARSVRTPRRTGEAELAITLRKLHGGDAAGRVCLRPAHGRSAIVGEYALRGLRSGETRTVRFDVSDEVAIGPPALAALEPTESGGYLELLAVQVTARGRRVAAWKGAARTRRTFAPPVLVRLAPPPARPVPVDLLPSTADRLGGAIDLVEIDNPGVPSLTGDGFAEWWIDLPAAQRYRLFLRYSPTARRPCDIVIDGADLNPRAMCALSNAGPAAGRPPMWEYQGSVLLAAGPHHVRVQDMIPQIHALRLIPEPDAGQPSAFARAPWPAPPESFLPPADRWRAEEPLSDGSAGRVHVLPLADGLRFVAEISAGGLVRFRAPVRCDLRAMGRMRLTGVASGSLAAASLRLVDVHGAEWLLWRIRDRRPGARRLVIPLDLEGMSMFDAAHVAAVCVDLEGVTADSARIDAIISAVTLERRDAVTLARHPAPPPVRSTRPGSTLRAPAFRPWARPVVPENHPAFAAAAPKPVTRATLGYGLHFTGARDITAAAIKQFHVDYRFGDICWPHIGILPQRRDFADAAAYARALTAMEERLKAVSAAGLFLFDIWGYVPYGEAGPTPQVAPEHDEALKRIFGDRFLGYDNGEQDGRYIGSYADRGAFTDRRGGYADFVKWDEAICADNRGYMNATGSLNFSHYYGERGARTLGLETAQGLPSDTLMFAFLRGASRQYGRLTTQATSVWSRFGYTMYHDRKTEGGGGYGQGPNRGASLSLHERLLLSSYTGGDSICGTETAQFTADALPDGAQELSPLGRQHLRVADWVARHPERGVLCAPVAFMLDFHNGWSPPRHLYRADLFKVWGRLPYEKGDYQIDQAFRMVWPGYEDASYLRNERGFVCDTPFGDIFDVITNRCPAEVLRQYAAIVLLGEVEMTPPLVTALEAYVRAGGDLVIDAARARALPPALLGAVIAAESEQGVATRLVADGRGFGEYPFTYQSLTAAGALPLLLAGNGDLLATLHRVGRGRVILIAADGWLSDRLTHVAPDLAGIDPPYRLLDGVRALLTGYLAGFSPAVAEPRDVTLRTNLFERDPRRMLITLFNNNPQDPWRGIVRVRRGAVRSARGIYPGADVRLAADGALAVAIPPGGSAIIEVRLR